MTLSGKYAIPAVALTVLFVFVPAVLIVVLSLFKTNLMSWEFIGVSNYIKIWRGAFPASVINSLLYLVFIPLPGSVIGFLIALWMADLSKKAQNRLLFMFMLPTFAAGIIISQFWKWIIRAAGVNMSQTFPGVPFIGLTVLIGTMGMQILLLSVAIKNIDPTQYEAAMIDGANWRQIRFRIIAPQVMKAFSVMLLFSLVGALQIWESILMLAPYDQTASMMFRVITDGFYYGKYGIAAAECVVMACIIIILTKGKELVER